MTENVNKFFSLSSSCEWIFFFLSSIFVHILKTFCNFWRFSSVSLRIHLTEVDFAQQWFLTMHLALVFISQVKGMYLEGRRKQCEKPRCKRGWRHRDRETERQRVREKKTSRRKLKHTAENDVVFKIIISSIRC